MLLIAFKTGTGFIVIVKVTASPSQPFTTGVTVTVLLIGSEVTFREVKVGISKTLFCAPVKPIVVFVFVQLNVKFGEVPDQLPDKGIA